MSELKELKKISEKLDLLITLTKLSNLRYISEIKNQIRKDSIANLILNLADGTLSSTELKEQIAKKKKVSTRTVERRMADLLEKGALKINKKKGHEIYYEDSGLYS